MAKKRTSKRKLSRKKSDDFSNSTVAVMLVVVMVVSALSLGFYLNVLNGLNSPPEPVKEENVPNNIGVVSLQIVEPPLEERHLYEKDVAE